jgi:hypothetical protein
VKKSHAVKKSKPKTEIHLDPGRPKEVSTGEIKNIVADTIERMYSEMGANLNRASAEDFALFVVRYMKHGIWEGTTTKPLRLREVSMAAPLCSTCKDGD